MDPAGKPITCCGVLQVHTDNEQAEQHFNFEDSDDHRWEVNNDAPNTPKDVDASDTESEVANKSNSMTPCMKDV